MSKLLRSDFRRLFKSKFFYFSIGVMLVMGLQPVQHYFANKEYRELARLTGEEYFMWYIDEDYFMYCAVLFFLTVIMTALFVGVEYTYGTMRNKITVGHKRRSIYFSKFVVLTVANAIWCAVYLATSLSTGIPLLGSFKEKPTKIALYILVAFTMIIAITSIVLCISMLCSNRTHTAIISLVLTISLVIVTVVLVSGLAEPEYFDTYEYYDEVTGEVVKEGKELNPNYISGTKRVVYEKILEINPGSQMFYISTMDVQNFATTAGYDLAIIVLSMGVGLFFFKRKDIK